MSLFPLNHQWLYSTKSRIPFCSRLWVYHTKMSLFTIRTFSIIRKHILRRCFVSFSSVGVVCPKPVNRTSHAIKVTYPNKSVIHWSTVDITSIRTVSRWDVLARRQMSVYITVQCKYALYTKKSLSPMRWAQTRGICLFPFSIVNVNIYITCLSGSHEEFVLLLMGQLYDRKSSEWAKDSPAEVRFA